MSIAPKTLLLTGTLIVGTALAGCQTNKDVGTLAGGAIGGLLGSHVGDGNGQLVAIGLGTITGAMLGGHLGSQLDRASKQKIEQQVSHTLEFNRDGQANNWRDPNKSVGATTVPIKTYQTKSGDYCREFQQEIEVAGQTELGYGTACRQPDGSWKIVG
ncbi:MAG: hypothetical protein HRT36_07820 [Alphaproteobacteria bacterium]|nr:hypothetical protein [Alphaproteobacteria bacterium]